MSTRQDGPRYNDPLAMEKHDLYENLMILCCTCHKIVDDQVNEYPADRLRQMKQDHECEIRATLGDGDIAKQRDDLLYAEYVDQWARAVHLDEWREWSYNFLSGDAPIISADFDQELDELRTWLLARVWPGRYPELEAAFQNFRRILQDFQLTFHEYSDPPSENRPFFRTHKFYKSERWLPQEEYNRGLAQYEFHVDVLQDLMLELTRAANYVCERVRQFLSPGFRLREGRVLAQTGTGPDMREHTLVPQYRGEERVPQPYPGLPSFLRTRESRDFQFGHGEAAMDGYPFETSGDGAGDST
ncbi:MAG: hypothetical protein NTY19_22645 [Planctomycetota bacterium]|nr:hypothetical protein [Planctomycetota bacterium]